MDEPSHDKTCLRGYRPCPTQHRLNNYKNGYNLEMSDLCSDHLILWGGQEDCSNKISRTQFFFSEKNIKDRVNSIVHFALYANKKTGSCLG